MRRPQLQLWLDPAPTALALATVAVAFLIGGGLGAVVVAAALVVTPRAAGPQVAGTVAAGLLFVAALATVLEAPLPRPAEGGTSPFAPPALHLNYASDRPVAAVAARLAGLALLVGIATAVPSERSGLGLHRGLHRVTPRLAPGGVGRGLRLLRAAAPYAVAALLAALAWSLRQPPVLSGPASDVAANLREGWGYTRDMAGGLRFPSATPPLAPLVAAFSPFSPGMATVLALSLAVVAVMRLSERLLSKPAVTAVAVLAALLPALAGFGLAEALAALLVGGGAALAWPPALTAARGTGGGLCLGAAALARPEAALALPLVLLWVAVTHRRRALPSLLALSIAATAVWTPWLLWIERRFEAPLPPGSLSLGGGPWWAVPLLVALAVGLATLSRPERRTDGR